jgi:hypothetical protein
MSDQSNTTEEPSKDDSDSNESKSNSSTNSNDFGDEENTSSKTNHEERVRVVSLYAPIIPKMYGDLLKIYIF